MSIKTFLREDRIIIPELAGIKRKLIPSDMQSKFEALKELDKASKQQEVLGLGVPRVDLNPEIEKIRAAVYSYNRSRLLKAGYKMVMEPPVEYFPRFTRGNTTRLSKVPKLAMVKLEPGLNQIRLAVKNSEYTAPIPRFPAAAVDEVRKVKAEAPNAEFYLLFMPNWKKEPIQRDPVLLAKVQGKFFSIYAWDGDRFIIEDLLSKK